MTAILKGLLGSLLLGLSAFPASAATITDISFSSSGGTFVNDTTLNGTSPLAFTTTIDLNQPFLNASDSTVTLDYGSYYAIAFEGFGEHIGDGIVSFDLNGVTPYTQNVTFPDPTSSSSNFAVFSLPGGDAVTIWAPGISADRITIASDGDGLNPDGAADAFYRFDFTQGSTSPTPEPATMAMFGSGLAVLAGLRRSRQTAK